MIKVAGGSLCVLLVLLQLVGCAGGSAKTAQQDKRSQAEAQVHLGAGYLKQGKLELALAKVERALEIDPNFASAHNAAAIVYDRLGKVELAEQHYAKAVALDPKDSAAQNNYGVFLCRRGKLKEAEQHFLKALDNPFYTTPEMAYENLGLCAMRVPDAVKAEQYFREALRINPRLPMTLYQLAQLSLEQKAYLQARAFMQRFEQVGRHGPASLWSAIQIERELDAPDRVAAYSEQLLREFPESEQAKQLQGVQRGGK